MQYCEYSGREEARSQILWEQPENNPDVGDDERRVLESMGWRQDGSIGSGGSGEAHRADGTEEQHSDDDDDDDDDDKEDSKEDDKDEEEVVDSDPWPGVLRVRFRIIRIARIEHVLKVLLNFGLYGDRP